MRTLFSNPDFRLRPQGPLEDYSSVPMTVSGKRVIVPTSYKLTQQSFPQLHARFTELQQRAGLTLHQVIIRIGSDRISHQDDLITIGLETLNRHSFDQLEFAIAHELGHAWREKHPQAPRILVRVPLPSAQYWESEADLFAHCLTQNPRAAVQALSKLGPPRDVNHANPALRVEIIQKMRPDDCHSFSPTLTPTVSPPFALQKQLRRF